MSRAIHRQLIKYQPRLLRRWQRFWTKHASERGFGRAAAWCATLGTVPYYGRLSLARLHPRGFIAPSASVRHSKLELGKNVYIGDRAFIFQASGGGEISLSDGVILIGDVYLMTGDGGKISIGSETRMHLGCYLYAFHSDIIIGRNTGIANCCAFYPHDHGVALGKHYRDQPLQSRGPIVIGDDVWLAHGVTVLSGVNIGNGAVVAAGAVVTKNIPDNAIAAGTPAKVIRYRG